MTIVGSRLPNRRAGWRGNGDAGHFTWEDAADEYTALVTTWWGGGYATTGSAATR